jgi:hypothetical protein
VRCLDPQADVEMLEAMEREIRGQLMGDQATLLQRLEDSFSNVIQLSPANGCLAEDPAQEIETMAEMYLEAPTIAATRTLSGRQKILATMREAWEQAGVAKFVAPVPVAPYTKAGDPFAFDFGYNTGKEIKLFHAVSMRASVDAAVTLAARYPKIAPVMTQVTGASAVLTAVVEAELDRARAEVGFALEMMEESRIRVASTTEMAGIAEMARVELRA